MRWGFWQPMLTTMCVRQAMADACKEDGLGEWLFPVVKRDRGKDEYTTRTELMSSRCRAAVVPPTGRVLRSYVDAVRNSCAVTPSCNCAAWRRADNGRTTKHARFYEADHVSVEAAVVRPCTVRSCSIREPRRRALNSFQQLQEGRVMSCWSDMYWFYSNYLPMLMDESASGVGASAAAGAHLPPLKLTVSARISDEAPRSVMLEAAPLAAGEGGAADAEATPASYFQKCFSASGLFSRKVDVKVRTAVTARS